MSASANEQLCLDVLERETSSETKPEIDLIDTILDHHHGDYRAAMADLLADAEFLRDQLYTASVVMSKGMGRGWKPKFERV